MACRLQLGIEAAKNQSHIGSSGSKRSSDQGRYDHTCEVCGIEASPSGKDRSEAVIPGEGIRDGEAFLVIINSGKLRESWD